MAQNTSMVKDQVQTATEIVTFAPNGLGFGEGAISAKKQLEHPELSGFTLEAMQAGEEIIKNGAVFVAVDNDANDDGCGDGRPVAVVYQFDGTHHRHEFKHSRRRAKIFGGGLVVAASMYRTVLGGNVEPNATVFDDRVKIADALDQRGIHYGGHTDTHASGTLCGCGAIDKYPQITANALKYRAEITGALRTIYGDEFEARHRAIEAVFVSYEDQIEHGATYFSNAEGVKTQQLMEEHGAIIKQLSDDHLEDFVVVNTIENTTFDQRAFDNAMHKRGIKGTAQVFVIDAWRGQMYAQVVAEITEQEHGMNYDEAYQKAEADFWIRTLAVSATLTRGDLPAFLRRSIL